MKRAIMIFRNKGDNNYGKFHMAIKNQIKDI